MKTSSFLKFHQHPIPREGGYLPEQCSGNREDSLQFTAQQVTQLKQFVTCCNAHSFFAGQFSTPSPVIIFLAILCISALCLPTENTTINSTLPVYLHLTINQKLVAAYVLGNFLFCHPCSSPLDLLLSAWMLRGPF